MKTSSAMAEIVLDSSAALALLWSEPGAEHVAEVIDRSLMSVVNEAEVISVLIQRGSTPERALDIASTLPCRIVDLDRELARRAGSLWRYFKRRGLSFGDRCCLALAERESLPVLTSDKRWTEFSIGVEVRLFR
jgi:PIN domain nuclease of toxin-antitoxin system